MSPVEELVHDLVDLQVAQRSSRGVPRERMRKVEVRVRKRVGPTVPKAVAARVLQVSVPTLDKWIARGRIPTLRKANGQRAVLLPELVTLAAAVEELRDAGQTDGVVAAALLRLEQHDPVFRAGFDELYGDALDAMSRGDLVPAVVPDTFGPAD